MSKKLSRRDFARKSVGAAAAAATLPAVLLSKEVTAAVASASAPTTTTGNVKAAGAAVARLRKIVMPPHVNYGGWDLDGRDVLLEHTMTPAGQTPPTYAGGWREGTTIPVEYYVDEKHYVNDERFLADHFWFMVDHHSRIPKPGDYFEIGRAHV